MNKYVIGSSVCLMLSVAMTIGNSVVDNLLMTIMWGAISIFEVAIFGIIILGDVNVSGDEQ